jgi:translation initiation factor 1A
MAGRPQTGNKRKFTPQPEEEIRRVKLPRGNETMGLLLARLGGSRCRVQCMDGKERICRIPGRLKRSLWVRENNIVIVEPWEFGGDEKGDIIFKYRQPQEKFLRKNGYLKDLENQDEF